MGSVTKRRANEAEGRRTAVWRARYRDPAGKQRSRSFARKVDAERFLSTVESNKLRGEWIDPDLSKVTFGAWSKRWLASTVNLKPKTRVGYESLLRTHVLPVFGGMPLSKIDPTKVSEWVGGLVDGGLSPARTRQAYQVLAAVLKAAVISRHLARTPCIGIRLPRATGREMRFLDADQVRRLAEASGEYEPLVYVLAYGGLRWGEAAALRRGRCDLLRSRIEVRESVAEVSGSLHLGATKTYRSRVIVIPTFLRDMLSDYFEATGGGVDDFVFRSPEGEPIRNSNFRHRTWRRALAAAKLPADLRIHDLRHTCAALLISQGEGPKMIQDHLGHSSITVTFDRYGHLFPADREAMAGRLDATFRAASCVPNVSQRDGVIEAEERFGR